MYLNNVKILETEEKFSSVKTLRDIHFKEYS